MNIHRLRLCLWNVLSIVLLLGVARADIGNVWVTSRTETSITINWSVTDSKFPIASPSLYQVCWEKDGDIGFICNQNSATMASGPFTITGLDCGKRYRFRVRADTWRKNWRGNLVDRDMRHVNTIEASTKECYVITGSGSTYVTSAGETSVTVQVDWSAPGDFAFIRLGYKKAKNNWIFIKKRTKDRSTNLANWVPNAERGIIEDTSVTSANTFVVTGLDECTEYVFHAYGFSSSPQHDPGEYIGGETATTVGDCREGGLSLGEWLGYASEEFLQEYVIDLEQNYAVAHTATHRTNGVLALPGRALALDRAPGSSVLRVHALESRVPASMSTLSTTTLTANPASTALRTADAGGGYHALVDGGASVVVLDTVNPLAVVQVSALVLPGPAVDVVTRGSTAYVACGTAGLAVVGLANPLAPTLLGVVGGIGDVADADVAGTALFVASRDVGVLSFDVTLPAAPNLTGIYAPGYASNAAQLATNGTLVCVANSAGLEVLDGATMTRLGVRAGVSDVAELRMDGALCFLLGTMNDGVLVLRGVHAVDISNPASPARLSSVDPSRGLPLSTARGLVLQGSIAWVALDNGGLAAIDLVRPNAIQEIGRWAPGASPLLQHLASIDAEFASALQAHTDEGEGIIIMEDMWEIFMTQHRSTFDAWQSEPALVAAGLDLATWMQANDPIGYADYLDELDPIGHTGFNIDVGSSNATPSAALGGATHRPGTWTSVGAPWSASLTDPDGRATIMVASSSNVPEGSSDAPELEGDDARLLEDGQSIGGPGNTVTWTFSNLVPGSYRVTTYGWNPNGSGSTVSIDVPGSIQGVLTCGGAWPGVLTDGITHVIHDIQLAGSTLTLDATTLTGTGFLGGFQLERLPDDSAFATFCAGDGTGSTPCPCANNGAPGYGCANSSNASGARLSGTGIASVSADTVQLQASSMTGATCVFFQGTSDMPPVVVGDGLGCVTGSVIRLGTKSVSAGASAFPQAGDPLVSVRGQIPPSGATRYYQCFYRNAAAAFCPPGTSNRTNGVVITWTP